MAGALSACIRRGDAPETGLQLARDFEGVHHLDRISWTFNLKLVAIKEIVSLQRFDQRWLNREPGSVTPIRIATKQSSVRLRWRVTDSIFLATN